MPTSRRHSPPAVYDHGEPIRRLSAVPLAGVLLILAVLSALAYPLKTHALVVDLPFPDPNGMGTLTPNANLVVVTNEGGIMWNWVPLTRSELRANLKAALDQNPQPSLLFEPQGDTAYGTALGVLQIISEEDAIDRCFLFNGTSVWQRYEKKEPAELAPYQSRDCSPYYEY